MARLSEDGDVIPGNPENFGNLPKRTGADLPMKELRCTPSGDMETCALQWWHNIEKRPVAELVLDLPEPDFMRLLGHALRKGKNVLDPGVNIIVERQGTVIVERSGKGNFHMQPNEAMAFWLDQGTRV